MADAPSILDYLCPECSRHFETVKKALEKFKINFEVDKRLVRGLDYYNRTTFEVQTGSLGAQNAVAGGGRYDGLVKALGGPDQPAIGFAVGLDRFVELTDLKTENFVQNPDIFIAALGEKSQSMAFDWSCGFGLEGITAEIDFADKSLKSQMKQANRLGAKYVLIVGEKEIEEEAVILRDMKTREQVVIPMDNLVKAVKDKIH
jgi:histidyl-tRNA synthetase